MPKVTVIGTCHKNRGMCNSEALLLIIQQIKPEVIFEELSPNFFSKTYGGQLPHTLETTAIHSYKEKTSVGHLPVDMDGNLLIDKVFKNDIKEMFRWFEHSIDYQNLKMQLDKLSREHGFPYLNSIQCEELLIKTHELEKWLLQKFGTVEIKKTYQRWLLVNELRENEMIKNIYKHVSHNDFINGLFLIGIEHRLPLIHKTMQFNLTNTKIVNWNFNYFDL